MNGSIFEVIVVGAGHAGLSAAYYLKHLGLEHIIFERGKIGDSWKTQRWDNFRMITPNRLNILPGSIAKVKDPEQFSSAKDFLSALREYVSTYQLPVSENSNVLSIEKAVGSPNFTVKVQHDNEVVRSYDCWQVVIASGSFNENLLPAISSALSPTIKQLHASAYKNAAALPEGAVLVVGSGQSGCDIAEDLIAAGRRVFLSSRQSRYIPRRYRGKDIIDWLILIKEMESKLPSDISKLVHLPTEPCVSSSNGHSYNLNLKYLTTIGVRVIGGIEHADEMKLKLNSGIEPIVQHEDEDALSLRNKIDAFILDQQMHVAQDEDVNPIEPVTSNNVLDITTIDLIVHNITSIVWATGSTGRFDYIKLPIFSPDGSINHKEGITSVDGLYFVGLPWQRARKSGFIFGVKEEASFMANRAYSMLR